MNILVSACLLGENCKYNGGNNLNQAVVDFIQGHNCISICPEMLSGLGCPRECVEIVDGVFTTKSGKNVTTEFQMGITLSMDKIHSERIDLAILQSRSPTCGVNQIYDGTFKGSLTKGQGLFAKTLKEAGIAITDCEDIQA
jgi:uncharacterized protein YbbK (DUF523 family)